MTEHPEGRESVTPRPAASEDSIVSATVNQWRREKIATELLAALLANPERYKYIAAKVEAGMSNEEATAKNVNKAIIMADALIAALERP